MPEATISIPRPEEKAPTIKLPTANGILAEPTKTPTTDYAIVAASGKFTTAASMEELWKLTERGNTLDISRESAIEAALGYGSLPKDSGSTAANLLGLNIETFAAMSTQERLVFAELAEALRKAGWTKDQLTAEPTGVFIAARQIFEDGAGRNGKDPSLAYLIPNKVSFHLNLRGPSEVVNTYCTSVYVAIHRAIQSMRTGECRQAIIGGVNVIAADEMAIIAASSSDALISKSGQTKSFSEDAAGFVRSEGVGIILLKPLTDAERDQDDILGVVKASAVYHGGKGFSLEAPSAKAIKTVIDQSLAKTDIPVDTIDYIEAHGIANPMADAIELSAINLAYRKHSNDPAKKWVIGTVKPTVGHPELAAGMASLLKVLKAFEHKRIPPIGGLGQINGELPNNHSLILPREGLAWTNGVHPRRAALNSYAVGGVNAHIVLQEYPSAKRKRRLTDQEQLVAVEPVAPPTPPAATVEPVDYREQILQFSAAIFELDPTTLDLDKSPLDYDFESIKVMAFIRRINEHFGLQVKMGDIFNLEDFASIFQLFEEAIAQRDKHTEELPSATESAAQHPLSEGQKGLWIIQEAEPETTIYNVPVALAVNKALDQVTFTAAVEELLKVHPILRSTFAIDERTGRLYQRTQSVSAFKVELVTLPANTSVKKLVEELANRPFDLATGAFRYYLIQDKRTQQSYVLFVIHHIVFDGTSVALLASELATILEGATSSAASGQDRAYFEFVDWEQQYLASNNGREDLTYWRERLTGPIEKIALPYDRLLNSQDQNELRSNGIERIALSAEEWDKLKAVAKSQRVNVSVFLLAAFKLLIYRLSNTQDIAIKLPTIGRPTERFERGIGYFVNLMLARTEVTGDLTFAELLRELRSAFIASIDHVNYPYARLLTELELAPGGHDDRFPVSFNYLNIFEELIATHHRGTVRFVEGVTQPNTEEYALEIIDRKDGVDILLKYQLGLFRASTIKRHLAYYQRILEQVMEHAEIAIKDINLLTPVEVAGLPEGQNDGQLPPVEASSVVALFEQQAQASPDRIALQLADHHMTFGELQAASDRVAHYLRTIHQIGSDDIVALQIAPGADLLIAIWGIL
ncbi:MAG: condensation domain-containing protein, partial [Bacteroidota bacterium]